MTSCRVVGGDWRRIAGKGNRKNVSLIHDDEQDGDDHCIGSLGRQFRPLSLLCLSLVPEDGSISVCCIEA